MTLYRVQFLDRADVVIREYSANAESLSGVLALMVEFESPREAVHIRVLDPAGMEIYSEVTGDRG